MLRLHHQLAAGVEQRGRAVAPLLDVRRVRGADQDRAHLVADRPQARRRGPGARRVQLAPLIAPLRRDDRAALVDLAPTSPAAGPASLSGSSNTHGPSTAVPAARLAAEHLGLEPLAARSGPAGGSRSSAPAAGPRRGLRRRARSARPGSSTSSTARLVAIAVPALVLGRERSASSAGSGSGAARRPAARTPGRGSAARRPPRSRRPRAPRERLAQLGDLARRPARRSARSPRSITVRAVSRRRSEASRPSAESTPPDRGQRIRLDPELLGDRRPRASGRRRRTAAARTRRGSTPRSTVTTRSARDHLLVGDPRRCPRRSPARSRPSSAASRPTAASAALDVERDAAGEARARRQIAEQQVRVGDRRLGPAPPVAGGPRARPRPSAVRRAARRRGRASRSSRRRRRPCGRRPSAAGSRGRRSRATRCGGRSRPRPRRRRRRCRPCRGRSRRRRRESRATSPAPTAPPAGPREDAPRPGRRGLLARGATPPEDCMTTGAGSPRLARRAPSRPGTGRAGGRGRRRSPSSSSARTRGTAAAPRARPRREARAAGRAAPRPVAARAPGRRRRRAGRSRPTRSPSRVDRGDDPLQPRRRPARSIDARRGRPARGRRAGRSAATSGAGFGAHRR